MKVGIIGAGTMGQGIAKAFAQVEGYEVALCDIKQEWADGGKAKIQKGSIGNFNTVDHNACGIENPQIFTAAILHTA